MNQLKVSKRGTNLQSSPIRKLVPFAEVAKKNGKHVFHLNLGQPDIESPQEAVQILKSTPLEIIEYSHSAGNISLRKALADYYVNIQLPVLAEEVLITTGGSEALLNVLHGCLDAGDEIIIPEPYYTNYNFFSQVLGIKIVPIYCELKNNFALPSIEEFEKLITPKTKAILINNPGNPTGVLYTNEELQFLQQLVKKHHLYLISDEVYREFCYDGLIHQSALSLKEISENTIIIDSFSKRYSLCGIRIGAIITKNQDLLNTFLKFSQGRVSPPSLGQIVAEAALKTTNKNYLIDMKNEYQERRNIVLENLKKMKGVVVPHPNAAFYCMAELPIDHCDNFCRWLLESFHKNNQTVMLAPGNGFYSNNNLGIKQVRIAYVLKKNDLLQAMDCLNEALIQYQKYI